MPRQPFEILSAVVSIKTLRNRFAQWKGMRSEYFWSWGRPTESDEYPNGTGKPSPLDDLLKLMSMTNPFLPVEVQEIALIVNAHASKLAIQSGAEETENLDSLLMQTMRTNLNVLEVYENTDEMDEGKKRELAKMWLEFETSFLNTKGAVQQIINGFYQNPENKGEKKQ